jgi:hypothetical protein
MSDWPIDWEVQRSEVPGPAEPGTELVERLTTQLHQTFGGIGFAVLRGLQDLFAYSQQQSKFTVSLILAIWREMLARGWTDLNDEDVRLNVFEANDGSLPVEIVGDTVTYKKLHFDPHSILFAHLYEAPRNLSGGAITFVNVRAYLEAEGLAFNDVFGPSTRLGHERRLVARSAHQTPLLERFGTTVTPPAPGKTLLIIVRNDPVVGVAHEIAPVVRINDDEPIERRFLRASIAPHH